MSLDDDVKIEEKIELQLSHNNQLTYTNYLTRKQMSNSGLLSTLLEMEYEDNKIPIIGSYSKQLMDYIFEYLIHHDGNTIKDPPIPLKSYDMNRIWPQWDVDFIDKIYNQNVDNLYTIANCANYFAINGLINLSLTKIATLIHNNAIL